MNIHDRMITFLVLALFLGATMEYGHGSKLLGILLFGIALLAISRMTLKATHRKTYAWYALIGILIILADIAYNVYNQSELGHTRHHDLLARDLAHRISHLMVALTTRYSPITKLKCNSDF